MFLFLSWLLFVTVLSFGLQAPPTGPFGFCRWKQEVAGNTNMIISLRCLPSTTVAGVDL